LAITDQGADSNAADSGPVAETSTPAENETSIEPTDADAATADAFEAGPCGLTMELLTRDAAGGGDASISCIDQTEVIEARYRKDFIDVDAEVIMPPGCAFKTSFNKGSLHDGGQKPVSDVDWCDAWAYCKLTGKRLCSASEWQFACNGGTATRLYPYGDTFDASVCNGGQVGAPTDPGQLAGCRSPNPNLVDMSGNMDEWAEGCLTTSGPGDVCYTHGGDWRNDSAGELMCLATYPRSRSTVLDYVGFRCCKSL